MKISQVDDEVDEITVSGITNRPTRSKNLPARFYSDDILLTERFSKSTSNSSLPNLERLAIEIIDNVDAQFTERFSKNNTQLWTSYEVLNPHTDKFLDPYSLRPLYDYALSIPSVKKNLLDSSFETLRSECVVFKETLRAQPWKLKNNGTIENISEVYLYIQNILQFSAKNLAALFHVAATAGYSSARVECAFSALARIDTPLRRHMKTEPELRLAHLHFEKDTVRKITFHIFVKEWNVKPRRLRIRI